MAVGSFLGCSSMEVQNRQRSVLVLRCFGSFWTELWTKCWVPGSGLEGDFGGVFPTCPKPGVKISVKILVKNKVNKSDIKSTVKLAVLGPIFHPDFHLSRMVSGRLGASWGSGWACRACLPERHWRHGLLVATVRHAKWSQLGAGSGTGVAGERAGGS